MYVCNSLIICSIYMYMYMYIRMCMDAYFGILVCVATDMHVCNSLIILFTCTCTYMYVHGCLLWHTCMCGYRCACTYMYATKLPSIMGTLKAVKYEAYHIHKYV